MAQLNQFYKCQICGNLVSVIEAHDGELVCCGQPMNILVEKKVEEGNEKHVPLLSIEGNKVKVTVSSTLHPMEADHYIELIEVLHGDKVVASARLHPGWQPQAEFDLKETGGLTARALCNLHGLWKS